MKDNKQSIADLIGALAEDIEDVKKAGRKRQFGQGRGIEKADGETGTCYTVLQWQCPGKCQ